MSNFKNASNLSTIKSHNRSLILRVLNSCERVSRVSLARATGLTKMAVTNIVNDLLAEGIVYETGTMESMNGRKPILLNLAPDARYAAGLYISRDFAYANIVNLSGKIISEYRQNFEVTENEQSFLSVVSNCLEKVLNGFKSDISGILGLGIASIGPLDTDSGIILDPPNFRGLKSIYIVRELKRRFGFRVYLDNDMNASAIAEKLFGKGKNLTDFIYVGVTNGIGSGIILDSKIFKGKSGFAGEIGHTTIDINGSKCPCGNIGCLELYANVPNTVTQIKSSIALGAKSSLQDFTDFSWPNVVKAAKAGDELCLKALDRMTYYLSAGIVNTVNTFDPEVIFLGHDIALAGDLILDPLNEKIKDHLFSRKSKEVKVELSSFLDYAPCIGAPAIVLERFFNGEIL